MRAWRRGLRTTSTGVVQRMRYKSRRCLSVGLQSLKPLVACVTGNDVFVSLPTRFGKSCRGLRAFESSGLAPAGSANTQKVYACARTRVCITNNDIHHS